MSTIKVNKIENTSTTAGGVAIDSSGHVQVDGLQMPTAGALSNRNLVVNGGMTVSQRSTSATNITTAGFHSVDRMEVNIDSMGTYTLSQSTDAPSGFANSFKFEVTTAQASPTANAQCALQYTFEAQDLQHLDYGTSSAKTATFSFWVKSSTTGTYSAEFYQEANSLKHYTFSYTVSAADTWEFKTVTIAGDTAGVINNDNGAGLTLKMYQATGSNFTSGTFSPGSWASRTKANVVSSSSPNLASTVGNTWQITGMQFEVGEKATPFEHRSYGDEIARCQRYYEKNPTTQSLFRVYPGGSSVAVAYSYIWNAQKRVAPTVTIGSKSPAAFAETIDEYGVYYFRSGSVTSYSVVGPITADAEL